MCYALIKRICRATQGCLQFGGAAVHGIAELDPSRRVALPVMEELLGDRHCARGRAKSEKFRHTSLEGRPRCVRCEQGSVWIQVERSAPDRIPQALARIEECRSASGWRVKVHAKDAN